MRLAADKVRALCERKGVRLKDALRAAGVSRTAYYSLLHKDSVLPNSLVKLARHLAVSPAEFLHDSTAQEKEAVRLARDVERIHRLHPDSDPENIRHTLLMLKMKPWDRLARALIRAQKPDIH